jgi:hypothetical protein
MLESMSEHDQPEGGESHPEPSVEPETEEEIEAGEYEEYSDEVKTTTRDMLSWMTMRYAQGAPVDTAAIELYIERHSPTFTPAETLSAIQLGQQEADYWLSDLPELKTDEQEAHARLYERQIADLSVAESVILDEQEEG